MSTVTPLSVTPEQGQNLLQLIKSDLLTIFAQPLLAFFQAGENNPTLLSETAAWVALQGAIVGALPAAEAALIKDLNAAIIVKIQAALASATVKNGPAG